jgi:hypothetical protein
MRSLNLNPTEAELQDMVSFHCVREGDHPSIESLTCFFSPFFLLFSLCSLFRLMKLIVMETDILTLVNSWQCWQGKKLA